MSPRNLALACTFAVLVSTPRASSADEAYLLGPGDHLQVRVSELRPGLTDVHQWTVFDSRPTDFIVGPDGRLSLPILGNLDASGKTTMELEAAIATQLQTKAGLAETPDASVQIVKFRPFYVTGSVDRPGDYEFRPGLTVLQAASMAGGMPRLSTDTLIGLEKDALSSRGDLRALSPDYASLLARQARVDAEIGDKAQIAFPPELQAKAEDPDSARAMREEQLLFESRRSDLAARVSALGRNKDFLRNEIQQLQQKNTSVENELVAMRKEFDLISGLVSKGLSGAPRQLELEQNIGQIEGNLLDVQLAITRANEDITKSDGDILALKTKYRNEALEESQDVRVRLKQTREKMRTSQSLVLHAEVRGPAMVEDYLSNYGNPVYVLSRRDKNGNTSSAPAAEGDAVAPGDVLRVLPRASDSNPAGRGAATAAPTN